jgi:hypothetical protein
MAVDKEQPVGETPPYQHEPATKTKPSTSMAPKRDANLYEVGLQSQSNLRIRTSKSWKEALLRIGTFLMNYKN